MITFAEVMSISCSIVGESYCRLGACSDKSNRMFCGKTDMLVVGNKSLRSTLQAGAEGQAGTAACLEKRSVPVG